MNNMTINIYLFFYNTHARNSIYIIFMRPLSLVQDMSSTCTISNSDASRLKLYSVYQNDIFFRSISTFIALVYIFYFLRFFIIFLPFLPHCDILSWHLLPSIEHREERLIHLFFVVFFIYHYSDILIYYVSTRISFHYLHTIALVLVIIIYIFMCLHQLSYYWFITTINYKVFCYCFSFFCISNNT